MRNIILFMRMELNVNCYHMQCFRLIKSLFSVEKSQWLFARHYHYNIIVHRAKVCVLIFEVVHIYHHSLYFYKTCAIHTHFMKALKKVRLQPPLFY